MKDISHKIKAKRKELRLSQRELADLVGVTTSAISQWEREETTPKGDNLIKLAESFSCSIEWLAGKEVEKDKCEYIDIPFYEQVKASAGYGLFCECENNSYISLPKTLFKYHHLDDLVAITSHGNSMEPVLTDQSLLVLNIQVNHISDGSMYVVRQDDLVRVKLISLRSEGLILQSYNKNYPDEIYKNSSDINIIGKVIWYSSVCF
jgi:phage repressor protein C with HTH and peptisase S24 domain